jgi:hypothetical protein
VAWTGKLMVRRRRRSSLTIEDMPKELFPDHDRWGTPPEERKAALRNAWLDANDLSFEWFFVWAPARLRERERAAGLPPSPPARRTGQLPPEVVAEVAEALERERKAADDDQ